MNTLNYPKSPEEVKSTLTRLSFAYNIKAIGAILSVILFFAFYVALVIACAYLIYWALIYEIYTVNKWTILLKNWCHSRLGPCCLFLPLSLSLN